MSIVHLRTGFLILFFMYLSFYSSDRSFSHVSIQISLLSLAYECIKVKKFDFNNLEI